MQKNSAFGKMIFILTAVLALMAGVMSYQLLFAPKEMQLIRTFGEPRAIANFEGKTHTGESFNQESFIGNWSIVFFGFTTCPDVCPTAMSNINQVMQKLPEDIAKSTQVVMVSVDPERDTLERLNKYVPAFNKGFIGVNAGLEETRKLTESIGVTFYKIPGHDDPDNYLVEHTARWFIIDPLGRRYALLTPDEVLPGEDLVGTVARDYEILREQSEF
ncbi:SCO family protein [Kangiella sp.]|uniref:SCO family protein n=1 Tax=Kangiella sp. TaxID=1920245 RepID=UPI0019CB73B6|nr:SCO family protein [Kangiella sp.]MBD3654660.1 SCO family protein [Kangiella sp.]